MTAAALERARRRPRRRRRRSPLRANTSAMPAPIVPRPTTPTVLNSRAIALPSDRPRSPRHARAGPRVDSARCHRSPHGHGVGSRPCASSSPAARSTTPAGSPPTCRSPPGCSRQGRRLGARALRRRLVQAAQLDEPAVHAASRAPRTDAGVTQSGRSARQDRRPLRASASTRSCTTRRTSSASTPACVKDGVEAHLQKLLAEQVRHARRRATRSCAASTRPRSGPSTSWCRDAAGGARRRRDQAARRHRRRRAAHPLPRAAQPRPAARPGARRLRGAGDQAAGRACSPPTAASAASTLDYDALRGHDTSEHRLF